MKRKAVSAVFDRKKEVGTKGKGKVEIVIRISRNSQKRVILDVLTPAEWEMYKDMPYLKSEMEKYEKIVSAMETFGEEMTIENFNAHIGIEGKAYSKKAEATKEEEEVQEEKKLSQNFLDFMRDNIATAKMRESTRRQKTVTLNALIDFGKIKTFADLTPQNLRAFNEWLLADGTRSEVCVHNYHKNLHIQTKKAYQEGIIKCDPYEKVSFPRGKCKERKPLSEHELKLLREAELPPKEARVRDLFIFAAYTGLAYCDVHDFNFKRMTEKINDLYYIDGSRLKTGSNFFTPILAPAMEVLKKYNYKLPIISNQKANDYLHLIESRLCINKPMTFHVARHSFATLALNHDVPIEKVARMLGHKDIKTTQVYAKILKSSVANHAATLSNAIL